MRKPILLLVSFLLLCGCSRPVSEEVFLGRLLENENLADSNVLVLYIAEGMCSECINKELINLSEHDEIARHTVIVGKFANKRHFLSSVASLTVRRKVFISSDEMPEMEFTTIRQPHYILYLAPTRTFEPSYYPTDCSVERTIEYYRNIRVAFLPLSLSVTESDSAK